MGFPGGAVVKNWPASAGDAGSITGSGGPSGGGNGSPLHILAREIPWIEELVGYSPWDLKESDTTE